MARGKSTITVTGEHVEAEAVAVTDRVQSLDPRDGEMLSSLEEAVVRMHHGIGVKTTADLATNGFTAELQRQLQELEARAFEMSGRLDEVPLAPVARSAENPRTARIVNALNRVTALATGRERTKKV